MIVLSITIQQWVWENWAWFMKRDRKESGVGEAVRSPELETHKHDCTNDRPLVP